MWIIYKYAICLYMNLVDFGFVTTYALLYLFKFIELNALFYVLTFPHVMFDSATIMKNS